MVRASSYNIYIDLPNGSRDILLVHGFSGAYDRVAASVGTYVRSLEAHPPPKPLYGDWSSEAMVVGEASRPSDDTIRALTRRGYLTSMSVAEEKACLVRICERLHARARRQVQYLFMPTYDCSLRCPYCFQGHMRTDPTYRRLLRTMTPALVDRVFAALPALEVAHSPGNSRALDHRRIGFYGGEPLLARSRPTVDRVMDRARAIGTAEFWAVTNGTELSAYRDILNPAGISHLQITLDGPPAEHDTRRIYPDGNGTFEQIAGNIELALDQGVSIAVRINVDRDNVHHMPALASEVVRRGWTQSGCFSAYAAPVIASAPGTDKRHLFSSWELTRALKNLRGEHADVSVIDTPDDDIRRQTRSIFSGGEELDPLIYSRSSFCGAHTGMYVFDAFGDIYACWERTGDSRIRIGRVTDEGEIRLNTDLNQKWRTRTVATTKACRQCRYALHCGGGCAVLAEGQNGGFFTNHCDGYSLRFRSAVADAYLEYVECLPAEDVNERMCEL